VPRPTSRVTKLAVLLRDVQTLLREVRSTVVELGPTLAEFDHILVRAALIGILFKELWRR